MYKIPLSPAGGLLCTVRLIFEIYSVRDTKYFHGYSDSKNLSSMGLQCHNLYQYTQNPPKLYSVDTFNLPDHSAGDQNCANYL